MTRSTLHLLLRRGIPAAVVLTVALIGPWSAETRGDDWPQFRGANGDNKVTGFTAPATWPKELKKGWSVSVGDGLASPALVGDKIYTFTRKGGDEVITCLDAATGKPVWTDKYATEEVRGMAAGKGQDSFAGPRSSPAVGEGKVCTFGVAGVLTCIDAASGKRVWQKETKAKPMFFTACSPTIADGKCIVYTGSSGGFGGKGGKGGGGKGDLTAFDLATGEAKWKHSGEGPGYGSPVVATIAGVKQVVILSEANLIGVALADGKELWKTEFNQGRYQTATPVIDGDLVITAGSAFKVEKKDDKFTAKREWRDQAPHQYNTPVLKEGILYGYAASGGGMGRSTRIYAQDAKTGKAFWTDGASGGECGSILDAGAVLIALSSDGNLIVFKGSKEDFKEVAKYKVAAGGTWSIPVVADKRIFVKDRDALTLWTIE